MSWRWSRQQIAWLTLPRRFHSCRTPQHRANTKQHTSAAICKVHSVSVHWCMCNVMLIPVIAVVYRAVGGASTCTGPGPPYLQEQDDDGHQVRRVTRQTEDVHVVDVVLQQQQQQPKESLDTTTTTTTTGLTRPQETGQS